jgi:hypothetical protein
MKILKTCTLCLISFLSYPSNSKNTKQPFCSVKCYGSWQKGKSFTEQQKSRPIRKCSVQDCPKKHFGQDYCKKHYRVFITKPVSKKKIRPQKPLNICKHCNNLTKNKLFCSMKCSFDSRQKPFILKKGYKKILKYGHHRADKKGYVFEHILIIENHIGREVKYPEEIHHIDKNRSNNDISNLLLCKDHKEHMQYHKFCISK